MQTLAPGEASGEAWEPTSGGSDTEVGGKSRWPAHVPVPWETGMAPGPEICLWPTLRSWGNRCWKTEKPAESSG